MASEENFHLLKAPKFYNLFSITFVNASPRFLIYFVEISVQAKLRSLHDFHQRLLHNSVPLPSGVDIANTIKYFSQTLLSEYLAGF